MVTATPTTSLALPGVLVKKYDGWFAILEVKHGGNLKKTSIVLAEMMSENGFHRVRKDSVHKREDIYYSAFDILIYKNRDVRDRTYMDRLRLLAQICDESESLVIHEQRTRARGSSGNNPVPTMAGFNLCKKLRMAEYIKVHTRSQVWQIAREWSQIEGVEGAVLTHGENGLSAKRTKIKPEYESEIRVATIKKNSSGRITSVKGAHPNNGDGIMINVRNVPQHVKKGDIVTYKTNYSTAGRQAAIFVRIRNDDAYEMRAVPARASASARVKREVKRKNDVMIGILNGDTLVFAGPFDKAHAWLKKGQPTMDVSQWEAMPVEELVNLCTTKKNAEQCNQLAIAMPEGLKLRAVKKASNVGDDKPSWREIPMDQYLEGFAAIARDAEPPLPLVIPNGAKPRRRKRTSSGAAAGPDKKAKRAKKPADLRKQFREAVQRYYHNVQQGKEQDVVDKTIVQYIERLKNRDGKNFKECKEGRVMAVQMVQDRSIKDVTDFLLADKNNVIGIEGGKEPYEISIATARGKFPYNITIAPVARLAQKAAGRIIPTDAPPRIRR